MSHRRDLGRQPHEPLDAGFNGIDGDHVQAQAADVMRTCCAGLTHGHRVRRVRAAVGARDNVDCRKNDQNGEQARGQQPSHATIIFGT